MASSRVRPRCRAVVWRMKPSGVLSTFPGHQGQRMRPLWNGLSGGCGGGGGGSRSAARPVPLPCAAAARQVPIDALMSSCAGWPLVPVVWPLPPCLCWLPSTLLPGSALGAAVPRAALRSWAGGFCSRAPLGTGVAWLSPSVGMVGFGGVSPPRGWAALASRGPGRLAWPCGAKSWLWCGGCCGLCRTCCGGCVGGGSGATRQLGPVARGPPG